MEPPQFSTTPPQFSTTSSTPIPDPTERTNEQLSREIARLAESVDLKIFAANERLNAQVELTDSRFDQASAAREAMQDKLLTKLSGVEEVINVKFDAIHDKFASLEDLRKEQKEDTEKRRNEQKTDTAIAVTAALTAADQRADKQTLAFERSIEKSETSQIRQFETMTSNSRSEVATIIASLGEIKERLTRIEGTKIGNQETAVATRTERDESRGNTNIILSVVGLMLTLAIIGLTIAQATGH